MSIYNYSTNNNEILQNNNGSVYSKLNSTNNDNNNNNSSYNFNDEEQEQDNEDDDNKISNMPLNRRAMFQLANLAIHNNNNNNTNTDIDDEINNNDHTNTFTRQHSFSHHMLLQQQLLQQGLITSKDATLLLVNQFAHNFGIKPNTLHHHQSSSQIDESQILTTRIQRVESQHNIKEYNNNMDKSNHILQSTPQTKLQVTQSFSNFNHNHNNNVDNHSEQITTTTAHVAPPFAVSDR
eukprot:UN02696